MKAGDLIRANVCDFGRVLKVTDNNGADVPLKAGQVMLRVTEANSEEYRKEICLVSNIDTGDIIGVKIQGEEPRWLRDSNGEHFARSAMNFHLVKLV